MYKKALKEYSIKNCSTVQQNCVKKLKIGTVPYCASCQILTQASHCASCKNFSQPTCCVIFHMFIQASHCTSCHDFSQTSRR